MSKFTSLFFCAVVAWVLVALLYSGCTKYKAATSTAQPITHETWTSLLQKHVWADGRVNYPGFIADEKELSRYLTLLQTHHPNPTHWTREEQMAYWINAYNAFTIALIIKNYPIQSIKNITRGPNIPFVNSPWDIQFITIENRLYDLNAIEHQILRGYFKDPRIHFAINCASKSCPNLMPQAFTAQNLNAQLDSAARFFLADTTKNKITPHAVQLSKIFSWFKADFTRHHSSLIGYLNQYAPITINPSASVSYMEYNWQLNE
ncbi:MAG TPA: DUF547 domain-containing protein [Chitinophagales bacterium]|nr:DUF547 domain-containing protein [Chitinophagales bacterium]HRK28344.1 DUF547 domain-containing protein [Chitinophagales bacterium]